MLAAALVHFGIRQPAKVLSTARGLLRNAMHWERYKDLPPHTPDELYAERDWLWLKKELGARRFFLTRHEDATGISGTGRIAEGVVFNAGHVGMVWTTNLSSAGFYQDLDVMLAIHGHGGRTTVEWADA